MPINFFRPPGSNLSSGTKLKIDLSHPLSVGLISCWAPGVGLNDLCDTGLDLKMSAQCAFGSSVEGIDVTTTASASVAGLSSPVIGAAHPLRNWSQLTMYWRGVTTSTSVAPSGSPRFFAIEFDNANGSPFLVAGAYSSTSVGLQLAWNSGGSFTTGASFNAPSTANVLFSVAMTFAAGGQAFIYNNGVQQGVGTSFGASNPNTSATSLVDIAGQTQASPTASNLKTYVAYIWNRQFSAAEIAYLDLYPYDFLVPAEGEWPVEFLPPPVLPIMGQIWI